MSTQLTAIEILQTMSINNDVDKMRQNAKGSIHIAGRMALAGQMTVFYASPNVGKTLITLKLIAEAIANEKAGKHVYYLNLDDTYEGLITKADLGNRYGFQVISSGKFSRPNKDFAAMVDCLINEGTAAGTVFILDTIKKFVDVMDKKASSAFMNTCRRLTSAGGSIIALAHVNKHKDADDKGVPAGTSDVLDDCDCAYTVDLLSESETLEGIIRTVEFKNKKSRGWVVESAIYSYVKFHDSDYIRMFSSLKLIDGNEADKIRQKKSLDFELKRDASLIKEIRTLLRKSSELIQKDILSDLSSTSSSRRKIRECLKRWSCPPDEGGLWTITKGTHNSSIYTLNQ